MASAGLYASLHIAPDKQPRQYPTTLFFTGRMPFLPPNQQRQSTEGRKVKPVWILLQQETASGSSINWAVCKSAPHSRQITMPAPHHSVFYRPDALPAAQPTASKHWRHNSTKSHNKLHKDFTSFHCLVMTLFGHTSILTNSTVSKLQHISQ